MPLAQPCLPWPTIRTLTGGLTNFDQGKLLATGGVSAVEGEGGGGLTPWALISGYGTRDGVGSTCITPMWACPTIN